jgi:uncharacterized lipoprotein YmbA
MKSRSSLRYRLRSFRQSASLSHDGGTGESRQSCHYPLKPTIPKGLRPPALGCQERATLGCERRTSTTLKGLHPLRPACRFMESLRLLRTCTVTMNRLEKLRRSAMSIVANAPWSFAKLRRSGTSVRLFMGRAGVRGYLMGVGSTFEMRPQSAPSSISNRQRAFPHLTYLTNLTSRLFPAAFVSIMAILLTGCLFRPATVSPRHFVLAPIATNEPASAPTAHLSVGIAHVKMPQYLLRDSIAFRDGASEIGYLENASWGERLDQCFQRTLVANLSQLLSSDNITTVDSGHNQKMMCVLVDVHQFDVNTRGHGRLIAQWRITEPDNETPLKTGRADLTRAGAPPRDHPEAIATTLSDLAADFSRELAQAIRAAPVNRLAHE